MTNLEIILLVVLWIISGIFLAYKMLQLDNETFSDIWEDEDFPGQVLFITYLLIVIVFCPVIWVIFMFYRTFIKNWND